MLTFVKALGERIGPKSGTGRLLVIDGEPQSIHPETGPYFDYFIVQAYSNLAGNSDANLDRRLAGTIANFKGILLRRKWLICTSLRRISNLMLRQEEVIM